LELFGIKLKSHLSYPQRHPNVFINVICVARDIHLRLGVAVFEVEGNARSLGGFFYLLASGFLFGFARLGFFRAFDFEMFKFSAILIFLLSSGLNKPKTPDDTKVQLHPKR
jgi:hypothetical protein